MVRCDSRGGLHCAGTQKCGKFLRLHVHAAHKLDDLQILLFGFLRFQLPKLLLILRDLGLGFLDVLGKETIDTYNTGESRGRETSHSLNYQKLGKALMSQDELAVMDGGKCILQLRGVRPFLSDKYDITQHPNYKYTADADPKNAFDIEGYLKARLKLKPGDVCDVYEIDAA